MTPGISRANVLSAISIARHIQDAQQRKGIELVVSQHLPAELPEEAEISDEAMYELGETLRIEPRYMEKALHLYSDSLDDVFKALNDLGANPSEKLKLEWLKKLKEKHAEITIPFLNEATIPKTDFLNVGEEGFLSYGKNSPNYVVGYHRNQPLWERVFDQGLVASGIVSFGFDYVPDGKVLMAGVSLRAFTKNTLALFSGPIKDMTRQIPEVRSCSVTYEPCEYSPLLSFPTRNFFIQPAQRFLKTGDPY